MDKKPTKRASKPIVKKAEGATVIPEALSETLNKNKRKEAYLFPNGSWKFNKVYADATGEKYEVIKNPRLG